MATLTPAYRLRVYAPRSVDATETTVLTPVATAPHADPFQVASIPGVNGYRPYLVAPRGRRNRLDVISKRVELGELTYTLFDVRTPTGSNAQRWFTAFAGDVDGKPLLLNCRVEADESLDGGTTWTRFHTGRVEVAALAGVLFGELTVRDAADGFDDPVFTGRPHGAIAYARTVALLPAQQPPATGAEYLKFRATAEDDTAPLFRLQIAPSSEQKHRGMVLTTNLVSLATYATETHRGAAGFAKGHYARFGQLTYPGGVPSLPSSRVRAIVEWSGGSGEYPVFSVFSRRSDDDEYFRPREIECAILGASDPAYNTRPPDGAACKVTLVSDTLPTKQAPFFIESVSPLTLWQDLLAGRFGRLRPDGSVRTVVPADTAAFTALAAARTFFPVRGVLTAGLTLREAVEQYILRPYHLGYRIDGEGRVVPFDCRRDASLATVPLLGRAAVAPDTASVVWRQERADALSTIRVEAFRDRVDAAQVTTESVTVIDVDLSARSLDVTGRELEIEAPGWRSRDDGSGKLVSERDDVSTATIAEEEAIVAAATALAGQLRALLGPGSTTVGRRFLRSAAEEVREGMWRRLELDEMPNAASATRGGVRLGLCIDRVEDGPYLDLTFLDAGANSVAVVPALASLTLVGEGVPVVTVTRNAAADPVLLQAVLTATSVGTAPTTGWLDVGVARADGVFTMPRVPAGLRLWVRGRSEPEVAGDLFQLPSSFVSPSPAYLDTGSVTAPSGVSVGTIGLTMATVSWTNGDADAAVEIQLALGSFSTGLFDAPGLVVATLPAGSTSYRLVGLQGPSVAHCVGIRHVRPGGRWSAVATADFTTSTADPQLARPAGLCIASPLS